MKRMVWRSVKLFIVFIACTVLFYLGLRIMHIEYEQFQRYDPPEGPAIKVFNNEGEYKNRFHPFLRFGE
ncbi:DUF4227 family protein [Cerasibacillus terrae]|uniref:DUF4227 family protein n=1 Tax=Cerasibacillus terrae TaxID=2498845 RepID=A0A5C8P2Y4_9BACI|nr:DUF4227 family protein [Cerasibacillus terrae]TXL67909.1 DUF4227 family protein [Cerasibacillus terrae]